MKGDFHVRFRGNLPVRVRGVKWLVASETTCAIKLNKDRLNEIKLPNSSANYDIDFFL